MPALTPENSIQRSRYFSRLIAINVFPIIAILLTVWILQQNLPEELALHFDDNGVPDRFGGLWSEAAIFCLFILILGVSGVTLSMLYHRFSGAQTLSVTIFSVIFPAFSGGLAVYYLENVLRHLGVRNVHADGVAETKFSSIVLLAIFSVIIYGLISILILPKPVKNASGEKKFAKDKNTDSGNPLDIANIAKKQHQRIQEKRERQSASPSQPRVVYADIEPNRFVLLGVSMVGLTAILLVWFLFEAVGVAVLIGIISLILLAGYTWKVSADENVLRVKNGLGLIRYKIPISDITAVKQVSSEATVRNLFWGIFSDAKSSGVVLSSGAALAISRKSTSKTFMISVDNVPKIHRFLHEHVTKSTEK